MDILDLLAELERNSIYVALDEDDLQVSFEQDDIEDRHIELLRAHKPQIISYLKKYAGGKAFVAIPSAPAQPSYPLSPSQQRLWVLSQLEAGSLAYNLPFSMELKGDFNIDIFSRAMNIIIDRHEILRTVFREDESGMPRQFIQSPEQLRFAITRLDFRSFPAPMEEAQRYIAADSATLFDLQQGPLLRMALLQVAEETYIFYYNMHHIISDGWSMDVLGRDVISCYRALAAGLAPALQPLAIQYKDYAVWQHEQLHTAAGMAAKAYWKELLSGELPELSLPGSKPRPVVKTFSGRRCRTYLSPGLTAQLRAFTRAEGGSLFMTLLAAWKVLLYRYTGEQDIIIGTPAAGRNHADLENQIGFYVNTLPLRNEVNGQSSFTAFATQLRANTLRAYTHQAYPFDYILGETDVRRNTSRSALFDVMIALQNIGERNAGTIVSGDSDTITDMGHCYAKFDMEINIYEEGEALSVVADYNTDIFHGHQVTQLLQHFKQLTAAMLADPGQAIDSVDFLTAAEKEQLLRGFNDTAVNYAPGKTVLDLFREAVVASPDNKAIVYEDRALNYREMDTLSNQLAHYLQDRHQLQSGALAGILLERSEWLPVTIMAILKCGAAYVPLDVHYPQERIDYIRENGNLGVIIDETLLADFRKEQPQYGRELTLPALTGASLAYCIYTSGSTGHPKGVLNLHEGLYNRLLWMKEDLHIGPSDIFLQKTPYTFDVSVWELLLPFISGSCLVMARPEGHKDPQYLQQLIAQENVSVIHFVPSMLGAFLAGYQAGATPLRHVVCSGEELPAAMVAQFRELLPGVRIHNLYGPTEASIDVTAIDVTEASLDQGVSIGRPVANTQIYIVNPAMQLQPAGVAGELVIGGIQVARGYLDLPEQTASRFMPDPFKAGQRIYRTGDSARWLPDGTIQYLGRMDHQVKIRGNRIELGEVEQVLSSYIHIRQAVVTAQEVHGTKALVAYYVPSAATDKSELKNWLQQKLPEYMVPAYFVEMEDIPLTSSGKANRKALPPVSGGDMIRGEYVAPVTPMELQLVGIWQEVLGVSGIGVTDSFFELGGHSLKATQLIAAYFRTFRFRPKLQELFEHTTVRSHIALIHHSAGEVYERIAPAAATERYPLSSAQEMVWTLSQVKDGLIAYNIPTVSPAEPDFDPAAFKRALARLIDRHEILRTVFRTDADGMPYQYVLDSHGLNYVVEEADIRQAADPHQHIYHAIFENDLYRSFDLQNGPLFRVTLFHTSQGYYIYYLVHHIITDGISAEVAARDIRALYQEESRGTSVPLPQLDIQYKDFAVWEKDQLQQGHYDAHRKYWMQHLSGEIPPVDLPAARKRPAVKTHNGRYLSTYLPKALTAQLYDFTKKYNGSLFMTLLAAWNALLYRYTGQSDIVLGAPYAGRVHPDLENQIGCYINTLSLRNRVNGEGSFLSLYDQVKQHTLAAFQYQMYPFSQLVRDLKVRKDISRSNVLFDIMIALQNFEGKVEAPDKSEEELNSIVDLGMRYAKFDMEISLYERGEYIMFRLKYNTDVYDYDLIAGLMQHFKQFTAAMLADPGQAIDSVDFLTAAEKEQLLRGFNDTAVNYAPGKTVLDLFREAVVASPDNKAIVYEDRALNYREMDTLSNQLAHYLQDRHQLQSGALAGILLERSEWLPVTIMAILKCGAAYVPLDVHYPQERIDYIRENGNLGVIIDETLLADFRKEQPQYGRELTLPALTGASLAYCIYTSGSTGHPKGVLNLHEGLYNRLLWMKEDLHIGPSDIFLQKTPYTFDVSVWELLLPFISGSCLVMARPEGHKDPQYLQQLIAQENVSVIHFVPSMLGAFLAGYQAGATPLRHVVCSGEELPAAMVAQFRELLPGVRIHNLYGPTEASIDVTAIDVTEASLDQGVSIGRPVANTQIYIVNPAMQLQPAGVAGELVIGGIQVARGYLDLPEQTASRFMPDPFKAGQRIYRTGDSARWLPDGTIQYLGRMDHQVKIRGNRIELGEVEQVLSSYMHIRQAVVTAQEVHGTKALVAYYVPSAATDKSELKSWLQQKLPEYMVPAYFVEMEDIPLTSSGKANRKALPPVSGNDVIRREYVAPVTEMEQQLVAIWESVLDVEKIGVTDNFFDAGGDSILAIRLVSRINTVAGTSYTLAELFQYGTIQSLAARIEEDLAATPAKSPEEEDVMASFDLLRNEIFQNN
ncbi:amino acid adenylation domain-containing protein [Chitinophaga oryzae]|uniref:Amino acid adenylation domain-containing protein n=1 Tax=Chitinophaga oryzae TaxID=2725414 RepID=A0ABX6LE83_9BACT|nr:non-ribosomal peptide synthetase [Chitinophaga oryzae]QJB38137.1 amino acid adenylation domain-containing protein [Chitinophaga oryzae]